MPGTTKVESLNLPLARYTGYVIVLLSVSGFNVDRSVVLSCYLGFSPQIKQTASIAEIVLKVGLNTDISFKDTEATRGAETAYPSGAHEFTPAFSGVRVVRSLVFCVMVCKSLYVLLPFFFVFFCHCVVCPSAIYAFLLPLSYLQTFPTYILFDTSFRFVV